MKVVFGFPENAIINDTKRIIILIELQPSIILARYLPLMINFIDGSSVWGST